MWKPARLPYYIEAQKRHERLKRGGQQQNQFVRDFKMFLATGNNKIRVISGIAVCTVFLLLLITRNLRASPGLNIVNPATGANSGSVTCTRSYDGKKPVTQYAVMVDAGSSGSRVHVYKFSNCGPVPKLEDEMFKMLEPGLSSYPNDPEAAAASLDELMDAAVEAVPANVRKCTHVAVKATAGLRLLGEEKSKAILSAVRTRLETKYPFKVVDDAHDGVVIMDGKDEGVYAWITANYLLGNIGTKEKTPTAAVFDLGGGSTQIVFEPNFKEAGQVMADGDHKYELDFGGRHFTLYQHSHLGLGLNEARKRINRDIANNLAASDKKVSPCLPPGTSEKVKLAPAVEGAAEEQAEFFGPSVASDLQCRRLAENLLAKEATCSLEPCSFNGVHQPSLVDSFLPSSDMYVFSFFYDRTYPLGMPSAFTVRELKDLAFKVCGGAEYYDSFSAIDGAVQQLKENPQWCLDLNFMVALLHTGYEIPSHREVKIAKKIDNKELGWCLGASLPLLEMQC